MKPLPRAQIRILTPADQRPLAEALALLNSTQGNGLFEEDYLTRRLGDPAQYVIGAFAGDELLGIAVAELITNFDYYLPFDPEIVLKLAHKKVASFSTMSVVESAQGKGIGKQLSEARLKWVHAQGCQVVLGVSWESGKPGTSRRTFEGSGFRAVERLPDFYVESSKLKPFDCPGCHAIPCTCGAILYRLDLPPHA